MSKPARRRARPRPRRTAARSSGRASSRRRWLILSVAIGTIALAGVATALGAVGGNQSPAANRAVAHALTSEEANRLAASRFLNFQKMGVRFSTSVPTPDGPLPLTGELDFSRKVGIAVTKFADIGGTGGAAGTDRAIIEWNSETVYTWLGAGDGVTVPTGLPITVPTRRSLDPSASNVDTALALLLNLGSDQPDDAHLLQRSNARWLHRDQVDGVRVDVISGPTAVSSSSNEKAVAALAIGNVANARTQYWIDSSGRMLKFVADLASGPVAVALNGAAFVKFATYSGLV
jgi:hypothetical protein